MNSDYRGVRVAVLGASGFIGRWVARALCAGGARVALVVRDASGFENVAAAYGIAGEVFEADLRDDGRLAAVLREVRPSITFNLVGYGVDRSERDVETCYAINARFVDRLARTLAEIRDPDWSGQDLVHAGSAAEYGAIRGDLAEHSAPRPTTLYGASKLNGTRLLQQACEATGVRALTARLFTVYGPGEHAGRLLPTLLDAARTGRDAELSTGLQKRDFTYIEDVAEGLCRLGVVGKVRPGEVVNLGTGRLTTVRKFAEVAAGVLQIPGERLKFGRVAATDEMEHSEVAVDRLRALLSWVPANTVEAGVRKAVEFESAARGAGRGSGTSYRGVALDER